MSNAIECLGCGAKFSNDGRFGGQTINCPKCGHTIQVPLIPPPIELPPTPPHTPTVVHGGFLPVTTTPSRDFNKMCAACASIGCAIAGFYLLSIESVGENSIPEAIAHGIGIYCIAKAFFVGPMLMAQSGGR